jgi:hypothetical protein
VLGVVLDHCDLRPADGEPPRVLGKSRRRLDDDGLEAGQVDEEWHLAAADLQQPGRIVDGDPFEDAPTADRDLEGLERQRTVLVRVVDEVA